MIRHTLIALTLLLATAPCIDCGGPEGKSATVTPGNMPTGEVWAGVYFHPIYGNLNLIEQDNNVIGKWQRTDKSAWGQMSGKKIGNVLHFEWAEHKYGLVGPSATSKGKGYFVYRIGPDNIAQLHGEFGLDTDEVGAGGWDCVKQMAGKQPIAPDLNSITGETPGGSAGDTGGGFH